MVKFRGFGLNLRTIFLIVFLAVVLSGAGTLSRPFVHLGASGDTARAGTVYPCRPGYWVERQITNGYGGWGWGVTIHARLKYNGCEVFVVPGSQSCVYWAFGYSIDMRWCGNYRRDTWTAYSQSVMVGARFQVFVAWNGFPISAPVHMCQIYDRFGRLFWTQNSPYGSGC